MKNSFPFRKVYGPALVIALITLCGLLSALLGDGLWDELSWVTLWLYHLWSSCGSTVMQPAGSRRCSSMYGMIARAT